MDTITFTVEGIGEFVARKAIPAIEELEVDREVDEFLGGKLAEKRAKADQLDAQVRQRILKERYDLDEFPDDPSFEEQFRKDYEADTSLERQIALQMRMDIGRIRGMFLLNRVIVKAPEGYQKASQIVDMNEFVSIWLAYLDAVRPFRRKGEAAQ